MKKPETLPAEPNTSHSQRISLWERCLSFRNRMSIRGRIFLCFSVFTVVLLVVLWLVEVVFLDTFYRRQKMEMLNSTMQSLERNIDNQSLSELADRYAEENNICVLIVSDSLKPLVSSEAFNGCIIHHMSRMDMLRMIRSAQNGDVITHTAPMMGFRNSRYKAGIFKGKVPVADDGSAMSMLTIKKTAFPDGKTAYIFLNTMITPVTDTVQTIRNELLLITVVLILVSAIISFVLSKTITRPLLQTTKAARALSRGEYDPVRNPGYREISDLNHSLTQAAEDLHRVETMQAELIANISHDLRTPLTLIEGYAEVMKDLPNENTPENIQVIIDETKRLSTLVNSVLELNSVRTSQDGLKLSVFNFTECVRTILSRYSALVRQNGYTIVFEPQEEVFVNADEVRIQQVIYNLVNNALTYTGEDRLVLVSQTVSEGQVRFEVRDSGEGIAEEDLPYVWDRYFRGTKPHKRAAVGSGLGLNIVKEIMDSHHLRYGVESHPGEGSVFWFEIPVSEKE